MDGWMGGWTHRQTDKCDRWRKGGNKRGDQAREIKPSAPLLCKLLIRQQWHNSSLTFPADAAAAAAPAPAYRADSILARLLGVPIVLDGCISSEETRVE